MDIKYLDKNAYLFVFDYDFSNTFESPEKSLKGRIPICPFYKGDSIISYTYGETASISFQKIMFK
jgi:hypothetical protein